MKALCVALGGALLLTAPSFAANILINGDFETGDLTGWTDPNGIGTVNAGRLDIAGGASPDGFVQQTFAAQMVTTTVSAEFWTVNPADRSFNMFLRGSTSSGQINLRVVPGGNVQIFNSGSTWETLANLNGSVVTDGTTANTITVTLNDYGASLDYDVTVNGATESGVGFFQNAAPANVSRIAFDNDFGTTGFSVDNVSVSPVPEPGSALLALLAGLGLLRRRR